MNIHEKIQPDTPARILARDLGQKVIADALGVGATAVNNAVSRGAFPATWFVQMRELCEGTGIECPEDAFNFKSPSVSLPDGSASPKDVVLGDAGFKGAAG